MKKICLFSSIFCLLSATLFAQNTRLKDHNSIGWYTYTGTFQLSKKIGIHTEYQWRRDDYINNWQQGLFRTGINYAVNPKLTVRLGYANAVTYNYGDIPLNGMGRAFMEHRVYEMATLIDKIGIVDLSHRFMLEQRWVGRYSSTTAPKEDEWPLLHRFRYMFRMQMPLKKTNNNRKVPYIAAYDELCIGFGKNVNENIFDQNRLGLLLGYKFSPAIRVEGGYFSQILQLGRELNSSNVFQFNDGFILNTVLNFDLTGKS